MMKLTKAIIALGVLVLVGQAPLALAQKCNDERKVCRDASGPNVELTRQRYGDEAAQRLQRRETRNDDNGNQASGERRGGGQAGNGERRGGQAGDGERRGGQAGDGERRSGNQAGSGERRDTSQTGGNERRGGSQDTDGGQAAGGSRADTFSPMAGVNCVRSEQVCYSGGAPNPFHTAKVFGAGAASRLMNQQ